MTTAIRIRTHVEGDADGWWCVLSIWRGNVGTQENPGRPADTRFKVGPWKSEAIANGELKTNLRQIALASVARLVRGGGQVIFADFQDLADDDPSEAVQRVLDPPLPDQPKEPPAPRAPWWRRWFR